MIQEGDYSDLTEKIIGCCFEVHRELGAGFKEKVLNSVGIALREHGLSYEPEKEFCVKFQGKLVGKFRVDMVVEEKVILEAKAVNGKTPKIFESQLVSYLKASDLKVGLLINFGNRSCEVRRLMRSNHCNLSKKSL